MNNYALSLLNTAYKQYQKHDNPHYSVQLIGNANDIVAYRNALKTFQKTVISKISNFLVYWPSSTSAQSGLNICA